MYVSCDSIEYLPYEVEVSCHRSKKMNFEVVKFKNLKLQEAVFDDVIYVPGKSFIFQLTFPIYHTVVDKVAQYEMLNKFDSEINPYFMFRSIFRPECKFVETIGLTEDEKKHWRTVHTKEKKLKDYWGTGDMFESEMAEIYEKELNLNQNGYYRLDMQNFVFEELYLILDELKIIPKYVYENHGVKMPVWYSEEYKMHYGENTNSGGITSLPGDGTPDDTNFLTNYADLLRKGILSFKERVLRNINFENKESDKIYISRVKATNKIIERHKKLEEEYKEVFEGLSSHYHNVKYPEEKIALIESAISMSKYQYRYRCFEREVELEKFFESQGFKIVYMEDLEYSEQVKNLINAKEVAGLTGSGFVNSFMCKDDTKIFEIMAPHPSFEYSGSGSQNWFFWFSPIDGCMDEKGFETSCVKNRNWYRIGFPDETDQVEKIKKEYLNIVKS